MSAIRLLIFFVCSAGVLCTGNAYAALTMTIDSSTKTLSVDGTSTPGTPDFGFSVGWQDFTFPSAPVNEELDISSVFQLSGTTLNGADFALTGTFDTVSVTLSGSGNFSEISGTGTDVSYAGLALSLQQSLETYAASTPVIALEAGSGFGDIQVVLVPEPRLYASAVGLGALCIVVLRRRK